MDAADALQAKKDKEQEIKDYKDLLAQNQIRPTYLEIWLMNADGSNKRQITDMGAASFAPRACTGRAGCGLASAHSR